MLGMIDLPDKEYRYIPFDWLDRILYRSWFKAPRGRYFPAALKIQPAEYSLVTLFALP